MRRVTVIATLCTLIICTPARAQGCSAQEKVKVPGAERQRLACLDDMTTTATAGSDYTDASDWSSLHPQGQRRPTGVPGLQVDGYFPDTSKANSTHGWFHDSQFVIRLPDKWNGKLIVTGAPGVRRQYAHDVEVGDHAISRGYAYASTDKGNGGNSFYSDGVEPGDAGVEWNLRVTELAVAAKEVVKQYYGRPADRSYMTGISQGGYLTRWQLENRPDLYDGGVDWEGTFWNASAPNIFTNLVAGLRHYPRYQATRDRAAHDAMIAAGFAHGSEFLWPDHYGIYWDLTQRVYREEFDPEYDGSLAGGIPFCQPGVPMCDADYDYTQRPQAQAAIRRIENTGRIGKPMLTLHGTLDALLPIATNGDPYTARVRAAGRGDLHRYYVIENGNHVDGRYDAYPDRIRPIHPCWLRALEALEAWVERGVAPPPSQFVPDRGQHQDVLHECTLERGPGVPGPGPITTRSANPNGERAAARRLTLRPRRRGSRLQVRGRLVLPAGVNGCGSGRVAVQVRRGRRALATRFARLRHDCAYTATFRRMPRNLRVSARFFGNRAVDEIAARSKRIR